MQKKIENSEEDYSDTVTRTDEDKRLFRRRTVLWGATLYTGDYEFPCQVRNLSLGGARIKISIPLREASQVRLFFKDRGELPAEIVWAAGDTVGLRFTVPQDTVRKMFADRLQALGLDTDHQSTAELIPSCDDRDASDGQA